MGGHVGNTVTVNGQVPGPFAVRAGERIRLRLINAAAARIMALHFEQHRPQIIALNGQPCEPHEPEGGRVVLGPAMRADLVIDMSGSAGKSYAIVDDFYDGLSYTLRNVAYADGAPLRNSLLETPIRLPPNPIPQPDLLAAETHELVLQGGMMSRSGLMASGTNSVWSINGVSGMGDAMAPAFTIARNRTCRMTIRNKTGWWHPIHLHGFAFRILARNGAPPKIAELGDTALVTPLETVEVTFVADTPGDWMFHCHVMDHQEAGLMAVIRVA
jgi:FtsP/CotA-like multicopper oxidase with cupredoxin domain